MSEVLAEDAAASHSVGGVADGRSSYAVDAPDASSPAGQSFGTVALASVALAIKDGTHGTHIRVKDGIPLLSAKNISSAGRIRWGEADDRITEADYKLIHKAFKLEDRDLLLTIVGSLGRRAIYRDERVTFQRSVAYVRPDTEKVSERFLFHWFGHPAFQHELVRRSNATAQAGLYLGELAKTSVPDCPRDEQVRVARVLDTLGTTIRQTEAIIAKLKLVKQGLLHDLLTRGIDANGELRSPHSEAPHLYKPSPLGWIPKNWFVEPFGSRIDVIDPNPSHRYPHEQDQGVPICSTENFEGEDDFVLSHSKRMPEGVFVAQNLRCSFSEDQVIFARKGRIGLARRYGKEKKVFSHTVVVLTRRAEAVDQRWILWLARSARFLDGIRVKMNSNSGVPTLGIELINSVLTAFPGNQEQTHIGQILDNASASIRAEGQQLAGLMNLKRGLMDDLLTGRVRVATLLEAAGAP